MPENELFATATSLLSSASLLHPPLISPSTPLSPLPNPPPLHALLGPWDPARLCHCDSTTAEPAARVGSSLASPAETARLCCCACPASCFEAEGSWWGLRPLLRAVRAGHRPRSLDVSFCVCEPDQTVCAVGANSAVPLGSSAERVPAAVGGGRRLVCVPSNAAHGGACLAQGAPPRERACLPACFTRRRAQAPGRRA